jgi:uncharacterized membrane protein
MELWRLLAHNHWFTLNILGHEVRVCARCSGYILGLAAPLLFFQTIGTEVSTLTGLIWQLVCLLLALPLVFDWVTQSWGLRKGDNTVRLASGIILGLDLFIFMMLGISLDLKRLIFVATAIMILIIGGIGKWRVSQHETHSSPTTKNIKTSTFHLKPDFHYMNFFYC